MSYPSKRGTLGNPAFPSSILAYSGTRDFPSPPYERVWLLPYCTPVFFSLSTITFCFVFSKASKEEQERLTETGFSGLFAHDCGL
jgi:hypothetical protein